MFNNTDCIKRMATIATGESLFRLIAILNGPSIA